MAEIVSTSREKYYLEIPGQPGRMYLTKVSFGGFDLNVDGHTATHLRVSSPARLYPVGMPHSNPLHWVLSDRSELVAGKTLPPLAKKDQGAEFIRLCVIGVEKTRHGKTTVEAKYHLRHSRVLEIFRNKGRTSLYYELEFVDYSLF